MLVLTDQASTAGSSWPRSPSRRRSSWSGSPACAACRCCGTTYGGVYRLATALLNHRACPADVLMTLYHERREHEITYLALRRTLLRAACSARETPPASSRKCGTAVRLPGAAH